MAAADPLTVTSSPQPLLGVERLTVRYGRLAALDGADLDVHRGEIVALAGEAAAVIGGTSLFGGRGKMVYAVLGGFVIATIANGMGLIGLSSAAQFMVTALVLVAAATVDAVARRGRITS